MSQSEYDILNVLADGVFVIDREYTIVFANPAVLGIYGLRHEEVIGAKCYEISHNRSLPCDAQCLNGVPCNYEEVFTSCRPLTLRHRHTMPDGTEKVFEITTSPITDENGDVVQLVQIMKDVTAVAERERAAQKSRHDLEMIFTNAPFSISYLDREMRAIRINPLMEEWTGFKSEQAEGKHCYDLWGQYAGDETKKGKARICDACKVRCALEDGRIYAYERRVGDRIIEVTSIPVMDSNGRIVGGMEIGRDITENKKNVSRLKFRNILLKTQQETSIDGILVVDSAGMIISYNQRFVEMWDIPPDIIDTGSDDLAIQSVLEKLLDPEQFIKKVRFLYDHPDEKSRDEIILRDGKVFDRFSSPMISSEGKHYGRVWYFRDITDRKKDEGKLRKLSVHLAEAEEAERQRLARELHDEVGQKITALGINLQILKNDGKLAAANIQSRLEDSLDLIESITEEIRSVMADLRPQVLNDYGLLASLQWLGRKFSKRTGLEVTVKGQESAARFASSKETALFRIAQEALTNAVKHSGAHHFDISLVLEKKRVCLELADDGKGFDMKNLGAKDSLEQWGILGMKERAEALGARFEIDTHPSQGTKIFVEMSL